MLSQAIRIMVFKGHIGKFYLPVVDHFKEGIEKRLQTKIGIYTSGRLAKKIMYAPVT